MPRVIRLDVSNLEPPQPMQVITQALAKLNAGEILRVSHRRKPVPLFELIQQEYSYFHTELNEEEHLIFFWKIDDEYIQDEIGRFTHADDWTQL